MDILAWLYLLLIGKRTEQNRNKRYLLIFLLKVYLEDLLHFCNCSW